MRKGKVYISGEMAGELVEDASGYTFQYDSAYLRQPGAQSVSLTLPLQEEAYRSPFLFPFFANLLSEGENRMFQSRLLHIDEKDDFGLLLATAAYDTIGRVTVKEEE